MAVTVVPLLTVKRTDGLFTRCSEGLTSVFIVPWIGCKCTLSTSGVERLCGIAAGIGLN